MNVAAIVSVVCGVLGLLLLPIVFGPAALIAGFVGEHQGRRGGRKLVRLALLGILLGVLCTVVAVGQISTL